MIKKWSVRTCIVLLWIALIFTPLYWDREGAVTQKDKRSITVFTWSDIFDEEVIERFEEETGIQVKLNYYASNEEMIVKLKATEAKGYDIIIPSDYAVRILRNEKLIKKIDRSKLDFFDELNPILLGHAFDPHSEYSFPYQWEVYGFVYDTRYYTPGTFNGNWSMIFDPTEIDTPFAMINDPIEAFNLAAYYKFGPVDYLTPKQAKTVEKLLLLQNPWVASYASMRPDYFVAMQSCPFGVTPSSYAFMSQELFPHLRFTLGKPFSFITIENVCIPKPTEKDELIYTFLNYVMSQENLAQTSDTYSLFPSTNTALQHMKTTNSNLTETLDTIAQGETPLHFFKNITDEKTMRLIWIKMKGI